jgi:GDP-4-dehydro-6-deoxy-D-mannose reductase
MDLLDEAAVDDAIGRTKPSVVYHLAGAAHVGRSWERTTPTFAVNVRGTHYLLRAIGRHGIDARVLIPSSAMVYRPSAAPLREDDALVPSSPYGLSKLAQELTSTQASIDGIRVMVARPFNHIGPYQDPSFVSASFARQIAEIERGHRPPVIVVGNLEARRELTDVRDTVRGYRALIERGRPGRVYNICSGQPHSIRELLDTLIARARVRVEVRVDPALYRPNDIPLLVGDPSRIQTETGWRAEIPLADTLDALLQHWRGQVS